MSQRPLVALAVGVTLAAGTAAWGQEPAPAERSRLRVEASGGLDAPLGMAGLSVVFRAAPWLSLGGGGGFIQQAGSPWLRSALFARAHVVQVGRFTLGPIVWASFGNRAREESYRRPQYLTDNLRWTWSHALRLDAGLGAETRFASGITVRLEVGVGYVFGTPTCTYAPLDFGAGMYQPAFTGACDAPEIPAYYRFAREPGRVTPHVGLTVGFEPRPLTWRASPPAPPAPPVPPPAAVAEDPRAGTAWVAPTALVAAKGTATATLLVASRTPLVGVTAGLLERLELTVAVATAPLSGGREGLPLVAWLKGEVVARGPAHLSLFVGGAGDLTPQRDRSPYARFGAAGPVGSLCLDEACRSILSLSVLAGVAAIHDQDASSARVSGGALVSSSVVVGPWRHLKLAAEIHGVTGDVPPLWVVVLRVPFPHVAVDAGVALGVPVGSVSVRF